MNHDRLEALIWEWIDGEIAEPDLAVLQKYLAEHPEAREEHQQLLGVSSLLSSLEPVEAPTEHRRRIDAALATMPDSWPRQESGARSRTGKLIRLWPARLAYLAAGLVVGVVITALLGVGSRAGRGVGEPALRGVMSRHLENGQSHGVDLVHGTGRLVLAREGRRIRADLDVRRQGEAELAIESVGGELSIESLDQGSNTSVHLVTTGRRILVSTVGPTRLQVGIATGPHTNHLLVRVTAGGGVLGSSSVQLGPTGEEP